jgi:hypothetical protein
MQGKCECGEEERRMVERAVVMGDGCGGGWVID